MLGFHHAVGAFTTNDEFRTGNTGLGPSGDIKKFDRVAASFAK
jgi:hypothetical protein